MQLLAKNPDMRYQSAYGLKKDLIESQRRLLQNVSSCSDDNELIPPFEIALEDRFIVNQFLFSCILFSAFFIGIHYADSIGKLACHPFNSFTYLRQVRSREGIGIDP